MNVFHGNSWMKNFNMVNCAVKVQNVGIFGFGWIHLGKKTKIFPHISTENGIFYDDKIPYTNENEVQFCYFTCIKLWLKWEMHVACVQMKIHVRGLSLSLYRTLSLFPITSTSTLIIRSNEYLICLMAELQIKRPQY